jgi:hypothetical protein
LDRTSDGGLGFVTEVNFGQTANILRALTRNSNVNPAATSNNVIDLTKRTLLTPPRLGSSGPEQ